MGISDFISRQKEKMRQRQATVQSNREEKLKELRATRKVLQSREETRAAVAKEKKEILNLRTAPVREKLAGLKNLAANIKRNQESSTARQKNVFWGNSGGGEFGGSSNNPWTGSNNNPFAGGSGPRTTGKKRKRSSSGGSRGTTIIIKR